MYMQPCINATIFIILYDGGAYGCKWVLLASNMMGVNTENDSKPFCSLAETHNCTNVKHVHACIQGVLLRIVLRKEQWYNSAQ